YRVSDGQLIQAFVIPATDIRTEAKPIGLSVRDGYLIASASLPLRRKLPVLTIDDAPSTATILQPVVPQQTARGASVHAQLTATLTGPAAEPYDYAWRIDNEPRLRSDHGPSANIDKTPVDPPMDGGASTPQRLAPAMLTVIDIMGRPYE